jgi:hypothetical protein
LRLAGRREHKADLQVRRHLLQMLRSKVRSVVGVQNVWNAADLPVGISFTPDTLTQSQGRAQGGRRFKSEIISRHSTTVIIDDDRQPRLADRAIVAQQLDVELCVIDLPYGVRLESFTPVNQIEALAVRLVAAMSEHQDASGKATYDPPNNGIAGFAFLKSLCHGTRLPMVPASRDQSARRRRMLRRHRWHHT